MVEDFGDMDLGAGKVVCLVDPIGVFSVIFGREFALLGDGATPGARMPGAAADGFGRLPLFIVLVAKVEGDDGDALADEGGELIEGDDVGIGAKGGGDVGDISVGDVVVVIDGGDVGAGGNVDEGLAFFSDGAEFVVGEGEDFDEGRRGDSGDLGGEFSDEFGELGKASGDGGDENGEDGSGVVHGIFSCGVGTGFALGVFALCAIKGDSRGFRRNFFGFSIFVSRLFAIT
jgi:hypothetical protein